MFSLKSKGVVIIRSSLNFLRRSLIDSTKLQRYDNWIYRNMTIKTMKIQRYDIKIQRYNDWRYKDTYDDHSYKDTTIESMKI